MGDALAGLGLELERGRAEVEFERRFVDVRQVHRQVHDVLRAAA
jgi:hypothetical protein